MDGPQNGPERTPGFPPPGTGRAAAVTRWAWVSLPHATYAVAVTDGTVTQAPPIARWTIGKPWAEVVDHLKRAGARFAELP